MSLETLFTDVLCIGAGLAGERVAIEAASAGFDSICLSIVPARRSHSSAAQGGMQAALGHCAMGEGDGPDVHLDGLLGDPVESGCAREFHLF
jgi:fumarate reductase flavoprotein subunit